MGGKGVKGLNVAKKANRGMKQEEYVSSQSEVAKIGRKSSEKGFK